MPSRVGVRIDGGVFGTVTPFFDPRGGYRRGADRHPQTGEYLPYRLGRVDSAEDAHPAAAAVAMLAVPILIQVFFNSGLAYWLNKRAGEKHSVACPSALIGASNFFELAVAAAISLFGLHSGAALATVVGVLVEVPVMLLVVRVVNRSKSWYERG